MTIWSSRTGWKNMKWIAPDGNTEVTDLQNITFYNGMCLANVSNTFDILVMDANKMDPADPSLWDSFWSWFSPKQLGNAQMSLEGIAKKGGSVLKMFTMSKSGIETINSYFCVCTNMGEIIVWQGQLKNPSAEELLKNPQAEPIADFTLVGRFEIPIPLNKDCFCQMEGDMIVATQNGLFSLNRVVFGTQTEITQSLETRIQNVFDNYMFRDSAYQKFFGLYYYQKNRLLIFNTPTRMPQPMQAVKEGFVFGSDCYITLATLDDDLLNVTKAQILAFIKHYVYYNWLDYTVYFQFNNSRDTTGGNLEGIFITFNTIKDETKSLPYAVKTTIDFYITIKIGDVLHRTAFLKTPLVFKCDDFTSANPIITTDSTIEWNPDLIKSMDGSFYYAYSFSGEAKKRGLLKSEEYELTGLIPTTSLFATPTSFTPIYYLNPSFNMKRVKAIHLRKLISDGYLPDFSPSLEQFFIHFGQEPYPDGYLLKMNNNSYEFNTYKDLIDTGMNGQTPWIENMIASFFGVSVLAADLGTFTYKIDINVDGVLHSFKYMITVVFSFIGGNCYIDVSARYKYDNVDCPIDFSGGSLAGKGYIYCGYYSIDNSAGKIIGALPGGNFSKLEIAETELLNVEDKHVEFVSASGAWTAPFSSPNVDAAAKKGIPEFTVTEDNWSDIAKKYGWLMSPFQLELDASPAPVPPPPLEALNLEDCIEGTSLRGYNNLKFSGILEDPNYANFQYKNYTDFSTALSSFWSNNERPYPFSEFKSSHGFPPFGKDLVQSVIVAFVEHYTEISSGPLLEFTYTIQYTFFNTSSNETHALKMSFYFHLLTQDPPFYIPLFIIIYGAASHENIRTYFWDDQPLFPDEYNFFYNSAIYTDDNFVGFSHGVQTYAIDPIDSIFDFSESPDWVIQSISASSDFSACPDAKPYFDDALPEFEHVTADNVEQFKAAYGYLMSGFIVHEKDPSLSEKGISVERSEANKSWSDILIPKKPKILVRAEGMERVKAKRISRGDAPSPSYAVQNANFDLNQVPLLANSNIVCSYASTQYVMNSYYGTWSRWTDVNMIHGASHLGEFYFIRPMDIPEESYGTGFVYNKSMLCKFDATAFGDLGRQPISVSYRTASTNLGANNYKLYQRMKIIATRSTFWGTKANNMRIIVLSDFAENPPYFYQYSTIGGEELILKAMGLHGKKQLHELDFRERKKFNELYAIESAVIDSGEIGLLCRPSNRMGIEMSMDIVEANIVIYGYEITLKTLNKA
jgi:hypothetical protein